MTEQEAIKDIQRQLWEINMEGSDVVLSTESLRLAIKALKKQIPKKPAYQGEHEKCPTCGSFCIDVYCAKCGQALDWQ